MASIINIANIRIQIEENDFFKILSPIENIFLMPFVNHSIVSNRTENTSLTIIKSINNAASPNNNKINAELFKKIKAYFPNADQRGINKLFCNLFKKIYYLDKKSITKNLTVLLRGKEEYKNIIIGDNSLLIFNQELYRAYIFFRRPASSVINSKIMHNLNVLKLLLRMILNSNKDGIVLHGSSVEHHGYGYAFIGRGGSGKSTTVKILKPDRVLSDDTTVIRKINNSYEIFANPWWNGNQYVKIKSPKKSASLKAIFFITKAKKTAMRKLDYREALSALIYYDKAFQQRGFFESKTGIKNFYLFSQEFIRAMPAFELRIKKSQRFGEEFHTLLKHYIT